MFQKLFKPFSTSAAPTAAPAPAAADIETQILYVITLDPDEIDGLRQIDRFTPNMAAPFLKRSSQLVLPTLDNGQNFPPHIVNGVEYQAFVHPNAKGQEGDFAIIFAQHYTPDQTAIVPGAISVGANLGPHMVIYRVTCCGATSLNAFIIDPYEDGTFDNFSIPSLEGQTKYVSAPNGEQVPNGKLLDHAQCIVAPESGHDHIMQHVMADTKHACAVKPTFGAGYREPAP